MDISYEVKKREEQPGSVDYGCFTQCNVNTNYGETVWCCVRQSS